MNDNFNLFRKDKRFDSMNLLAIEIYDLFGNGIYQGMGKTMNLSMGGMLIEICDKLPLQLNYTVNIEISLSGTSIINVRGIVKWLQSVDEDIHVGIQFLPMTKKTSDILMEFLTGLN